MAFILAFIIIFIREMISKSTNTHKTSHLYCMQVGKHKGQYLGRVVGDCVVEGGGGDVRAKMQFKWDLDSMLAISKCNDSPLLKKHKSKQALLSSFIFFGFLCFVFFFICLCALFSSLCWFFSTILIKK